MEKEKTITILPNGPYEVTETVPLKIAGIEIDDDEISEGWKTGRVYDAQTEPYHLCRCGYSQHKPYCDGSHVDIGFEGEEVAHRNGYKKHAVRYEGEACDILDDESLCASMRFCDRGLGAWDAAIQSGRPENKKLAMEECADCASGRLTLAEKSGTLIEPELPKEINLIQDTAARMRGPLWVKGGIKLVGANGVPYEIRNRMTLCRCGLSENLPFCDASHLQCPHMEGYDT